MGRILAIDYGTKRTGIAVSDPLRIIATGLKTVPSHTLFQELDNYFKIEEVEKILLGYPLHLNGEPNKITPQVQGIKNKLNKLYPTIPVQFVDERFTSKMAFQSMIDSGMKMMQRRDKALIDEISACIILQGYLDAQ